MSFLEETITKPPVVPTSLLIKTQKRLKRTLSLVCTKQRARFPSRPLPQATDFSNLKSVLFNLLSPQWSTADAEIKDPSVEKPELKGSPFKAWSMSVYSHACFTYCQRFLPSTNFYPPGPISFVFFFPESLPSFSWVSCG